MPNSKTRRGRVGKGVAQTLDTQMNQAVIQLNPSKESGGKQPYQQNRVYDANGEMPALQSQLSNGTYAIMCINNEAPQESRVYEPGGISPTLASKSEKGGYKVPNLLLEGSIRRLTEIECERLQGFPDDWTKYGDFDGVEKAISRTQRYKLIGNAVTTNVVTSIAKKLFE